MRRRRSLCTLLLLPTCAAVAHAQDISAKISGTVTDPSGAVVAGATVTARETTRGVDTVGKTNASGAYFLGPLGPGQYQLTIDAPGFAKVQRPPFELVLNQTARIDVSLAVGQESQTVQVSGAAPLLETDQSYLGTLLDAHANVTLPLATRNYNQLTLLSPGAVSTNPGSFSGAQASFQVGRPYINGNREQTNNYVLDGTDNNQIDNNDVAFSPSVDAIQEFNLISQNAPASYGNFLGGVISVTLKSGTNKFHGDAFEFIRNDALNANTWANGLSKGAPYIPGTNNSDGTGLKPLLRWNEFGGTVGGPIIKDKLFFFVDYQGSRFDQPATSVPFTVLTAAERQGDFSAVCVGGFNAANVCQDTPGKPGSGVQEQLYNPQSGSSPGTRQPFVRNQIPTNLFSHAASAILNSSYYPEPINAQLQGNQINLTHQYTNSNQGDARIDYAPTDTNKFYLRYSQQDIQNPTVNSQLLEGNTLNQFPLYNAVIDWDHTFSSSLINTVRVGGSYFPVTEATTNPTNQNFPQLFGIAGTAPGQTFLPGQTFTGATNGPQIGTLNQVQVFHDTVLEPQDQLTWVRGRQTLNFGVEFFYYKTNDNYPGQNGLAGQFTYNGSYTSNPSISENLGGNTTATPLGWAEADFLLGLPETVGLGNGPGRSLRNHLIAGYAQDDWRILPNLTLNLGVRYEVQSPRFEAHNQAVNYNLQTGAVEIAGQNGNSQALYNQYNGPTDVQPRVGFAWQPGGNQKVVLRGAYGISNFSESTGTGNLLFQNPPFAIPLQVTYPGSSQALPGSTLDQGFSTFPSAGCTVAAAIAYSPDCFSGAAIHAFDPNFRPAVSQQYNLTMQFQLSNSSTFQLGYVGQKVDHLAAISLISQGVLNANGTVSPSPYLNPTLLAALGKGQARLTSAVGFSNYNSLQTSFQQRLTKGIEFQANYTWSKCMGNTSGFFAEYGDNNAGLSQAGNNHFFFQNTYDPRADYGRCDQDIQNDANGFVTYALPVGKGQQFGQHLNRAVDAAIGGWQANAIFTLHTGFPITPQALDVSGTNFSGFPRADCSGQPVINGLTRSNIPNSPGYLYLGSQGLSQPAPGTFGNCQVGSYTGPGLQQFDASVFKSFPIVEGQSVQFRAEAINVLNHPILAAPNSGLGTTFGLINNAQGERNLQFAVKYLF